MKLETQARQKLAEWLVESREKSGLSIQEVSGYAPESHPQSLRWVEKGVRTPSLKLLYKLIRVYKIPQKVAMDFLLKLVEREVRRHLAIK